jgi:hypothetical protein
MSARLGVVIAGALLRDQQDLLAVFHGAFQSPNRLFAADEQGNDHVRIDDDIAQRQNRQHIVGIGHEEKLLRITATAGSPRPGTENKGAGSDDAPCGWVR